MTGPALAALLILAASIGAIVASATDAGPTLLALQAMGAVLVQEGFRRLDLPRTRLFAAGELAMLVVVAGIGFISGARSDALVGLAVALVVWLLAAITATDLSAVAEPTDLVEGIGGATRRLNSRFLLVGVGLAALVVASYGGFRVSPTPRPLVSEVLWPFLVYWLVGLFSLTSIHRQRLVGRWQRDGARIDRELTVRWKQVVVISLILLVLGGVGWWWFGRPALAVAHETVAWLVRSGGEVMARLQGEETATFDPSGEPVEIPPPPRPTNLIQPAGEIWDALLIALVALLFGGVFLFYSKRFRRAGESLGRAWLRALGQIALSVVELVKAIARWLRAMRWRRPGALRGHHPERDPGLHPVIWSPSDPVRKRIAQAYRRQVALASESSLVPEKTETPLEYSARVGVDARFNHLAELYSEARYSEHRLGDEAAERAERLSQGLLEVWATNRTAQ